MTLRSGVLSQDPQFDIHVSTFTHSRYLDTPPASLECVQVSYLAGSRVYGHLRCLCLTLAAVLLELSVDWQRPYQILEAKLQNYMRD